MFVRNVALYDSQGLLHADIDTITGGFNANYLGPVGFQGQSGNYTDTKTLMEKATKLYIWFAALGFLLGAFISVYSQLHAEQIQSEAGTGAPPFVSPDGSGGVLSAVICGILGMICGLVGAFLTRLVLSFRR